MSRQIFHPPVISEASDGDIPILANIHIEACRPDLAIRLFFSSESHFSSLLTQGLKNQINNPDWLVVKATDSETQQIAGWASLNLASVTDKDEKQIENPNATESGKRTGSTETRNADFPAGLGAFVSAKSDGILSSHMGKQPHAVLHALMVCPSYQRRGHGRVLVQWCNDEMDRMGVPGILQSSPLAHSLYGRMGWKDVESLRVDLREWAPGGTTGERGWGNYRWSFMTRMPKK